MMTKAELAQYRYLKREISSLRNKFRELEAAISGGSSQLTGMPGGMISADTVANCAIELADVGAILMLREQTAVCEMRRILRFTSTVEDSMLRMAIERRYLQGWTWEKIALSLGGGNTADGVRKSVHRFLSD